MSTTARRRRGHHRGRPDRADHPHHPRVRRHARAAAPGAHRPRPLRPLGRPARHRRTKIDYWDARNGGSWRFLGRRDGEEYAFRGCFHTVEPGKIVQTFTWEGMPDGVSLETLRFEDLGDGRTRLVARVAVRQLRGPRRLAGQRHGGRRQRGLRQARRAARRRRRLTWHPHPRRDPAERHRLVAGRSPTGSAATRRLGRAGAGRRAGRPATSSATSSSGSPASWPWAPTSGCPPARRSTTTRSAPGRVHADGVQAVLDDPATADADVLQPAHRHACRCARRSTGSTPPTSSCTPGTSPAPPARTRRLDADFCAELLAGMEPIEELHARRPASTARASPSPTTPTPRTGCSASSAATPPGALLRPVQPARGGTAGRRRAGRRSPRRRWPPRRAPRSRSRRAGRAASSRCSAPSRSRCPEPVDEGSAEGVTGPDRVRDVDRHGVDLAARRGRHPQRALAAAGDHHDRGPERQQVPRRLLEGAVRPQRLEVLVGGLHDVAERGQPLDPLDDLGAGAGDDRPRVDVVADGGARPQTLDDRDDVVGARAPAPRRASWCARRPARATRPA